MEMVHHSSATRRGVMVTVIENTRYSDQKTSRRKLLGPAIIALTVEQIAIL